MSALADIYIKTEVLETLLSTVKKKGEKGLSLTISISDTESDYGSNVMGYVSQSKDQRDKKTEKYKVGYGKVFWTDGKIVKAEKKAQSENNYQPGPSDNSDDLPF